MFLDKKIALLLLSALFLHAEPSAFESQSGATKKDIKSLKDSSLNLSSILVDLQGRVESIEQIQHGLQSLYDGQSQKVQTMISDLQNHSLSLKEIRASLDLLKESLDQMGALQKKFENEQKRLTEIFQKAEGKIREVTEIGTNINTLVVGEFENVKAELKKQADVIMANQENIQKLSAEIERLYGDRKKKERSFKDYEKKSDVLKEAKEMYQNEKLNEAKDRFSWLVEQNYQKAEANYFLGQIAYKQRHYEDAIFYYRESATINDRAKYMPVLLINTIKSFENIKDEKNALKFIESLLSLYPKSKEAAEAKKIRGKLKGEKKNGK